jgi:NADPH2:quinone reductase
MRALRVEEYGEPEDVLQLQDIEVPVPGPGQVLARVGAAALNWPDVNLCRGVYHLRPPLPFTPGMEACGEVVGVGPGVRADLTGKRFVSVPELPAGALAEYTLMPANRMQEVPDGVDDADAAAMFIAFTTAHVALYRRAELQSGETLLVHAAAGGVGSATVQMGKVIGARVIAAAGGRDKEEVCRALGADAFIDSRNEDVIARVLEETGGRGADVVFDPVGGDAFEASRKCTAVDGRILIVGFASGTIPKLSLNALLYRGYSVLGVYVGAYKRDETDAAYRRQVWREINDLVLAGRIRPLIARDIGLEDTADALTELIERRILGKVVVRPA